MATKKMVKKPVMKKGGSLKKKGDGGSWHPPMVAPGTPQMKSAIEGPMNKPTNTTTDSADALKKAQNQINPEEAFKRQQLNKQKKGGAMKKYEVGGMTESESCGKPGKPKCKKTFKSKGKSKETKGSLLGTIGAGILGSLGGYAAYKKLKEQKKGGATKYKTGGMVNPNAKLQAAKSAGSDGVKSGVNPKASASKVAKGRSGGTSAAPKTATPKAKYGMTMKKYGEGGGTKSGSSMYNINRGPANTPTGTKSTMNPVQKAKAKYGMAVKRKK